MEDKSAASTDETNSAASRTSHVSFQEEQPPKQPSDPAEYQYKPRDATGIRYTVAITVPASGEPLKQFCSTLKSFYKRLQDTVGPEVTIGQWDNEEKLGPYWKKYTEVPDGSKPLEHRRLLAQAFGKYISVSKTEFRHFLNVRFVVKKNAMVEARKLGTFLEDAFQGLHATDPPMVTKNPQPCQAPQTECLGWLFMSSKDIDENTFIPACREALQIHSNVALGMRWQAIALRNGKRPEWDKNNPPPSALHLYIDSKEAYRYRKKAADLWAKRPTLRQPNEVNLRIVPCFQGDRNFHTITKDTANAAIQMAQKQDYFLKEVLARLQVTWFTDIDLPLRPAEGANGLTLRRILMSKNPVNNPTRRLFHNIDRSWERGNNNKWIMTTSKQWSNEASNYVNKMIPEILHSYGNEARKWFTNDALACFEHATYDPRSGNLRSTDDQRVQGLVEEDVWDMGDNWKPKGQPRQEQVFEAGRHRSTDRNQPSENNQPKAPDHDAQSLPSMGAAFGRQPQKEPNIPTPTTTVIQFDPTTTQTEQEHEQADDLTMSTMAKTTESTRRQLKQAKDTIAQQSEAMIQMQQELEQLRATAGNKPSSTQETPVMAKKKPPPDAIDIESHASSPSQQRSPIVLDDGNSENSNLTPIHNSGDEASSISTPRFLPQLTPDQARIIATQESVPLPRTSARKSTSRYKTINRTHDSPLHQTQKTVTLPDRVQSPTGEQDPGSPPQDGAGTSV